MYHQPRITVVALTHGAPWANAAEDDHRKARHRSQRAYKISTHHTIEPRTEPLAIPDSQFVLPPAVWPEGRDHLAPGFRVTLHTGPHDGQKATVPADTADSCPQAFRKRQTRARPPPPLVIYESHDQQTDGMWPFHYAGAEYRSWA